MKVINRYSIASLIFISIFTLTASKALPNQGDETLINTLSHIKFAIINKLTSSDIENFIGQAIAKGATGYKVVRSNFSFLQDMGWALEDSKGREVLRVLFTFNNKGKVNNGRYLGPLNSNNYKNSYKEIHKLHIEILSRNYKTIATDTYDLGDECKGVVKLFNKDPSSPVRIAIIVECLN